MPGSANTPYADPAAPSHAAELVQGTGTARDKQFAVDVVLIDPTTGLPYAAGGGGGGGGAVTVADGADVAQGTTTDAATVNTVIGRLKKLISLLPAALGSTTGANSLPVVIASDQGAVAVTAAAGTNLNTSALALEAGHLATIDSHIPAQGQALAAASTPVVLTAIQQTALTPPAAITGFALEAGHLANLDTHTPALGQALAAASTPVVLTAIQQTALTPPAAITGFALEAGHLATIDSHIPAQGQAAMAASTPVAIASNQSAIAVTPSTGASVALTTPQAALTANTDTSYTFASQVKHVKIQNKSASAVYVGYDVAATLGSTVVAASGGYLFEDVPCTVVHLLSTPATNVNGATDLNIVLQGYA